MVKGLRPSRCYHWDSPAYTRTSKNPAKSFITGIPGSKVIRFDMGNPSGAYNSVVSIIPEGDIIVRHNALEAARNTVQRSLEKNLGIKNYHFKINVFPHHIMRENVQAMGAGADRVSEGMRRAFGKPIGRGARVHKGQPIFTVYLNDNEETVRIVKSALNAAKKKLPGALRISFKKVGKAK